MTRLANLHRKEHELVKQIKSALSYPSIVLAVSIAVISALLLFVIPTFEKNVSRFRRHAAEPHPITD